MIQMRETAMTIRPLFAAIALTGLTTATQAAAQDGPIAQDKVLVLACLEQMEQTTTWPQCVELMFQPCVAEEVGSEAHQACLGGVRTEWATAVQSLQNEVLDAVTAQGKTEVIDLMGSWTNFVVQKCEDVAAARPTNSESARLGCEISELAGLSGEFAACLEGRSTAQYCAIE